MKPMTIVIHSIIVLLIYGVIGKNKLFPVLLGTLWKPLKDPWRSMDPSLKTTVLQQKLC